MGKTDKNKFYWRIFFEYLGKYKKAYFFGTFSILILNAIEMLPPLALKQITDSLQGEELPYPISYYLIFFLGAYLILSGLKFAWRYFIIITSRTIERDLKEKLFHNILSGQYGQVSKLKVGTTVSLLSQDINDFRMMMGPGVLIFVDLVIYLVYVPLMLIYVFGLKAFYLLLPFLLIPFLTHYYERMINVLYLNASRFLGKISDHIYEETTGVKIFRVLDLRGVRRSKFKELLQGLYHNRYKSSVVDGVLESLMGLLTFISMGLLFMMAYWGRQNPSGSWGTFASLGSVVMGIQLLGKLVWPLMAISYTANFSEKARAAAKRLYPLFHLKKHHSGNVSLPGSLTQIKINKLNFSYQGGDSKVSELKDISLEINSGQKIGLVGSVGSGKSTLLKVMASLYTPGEINSYEEFTYNGISYEDLDVLTLRKKISYIAQEAVIFNRTILKNIAPYPRESKEMVLHSLEKASLAQDLKQFPKGMMTPIGEKGINLSGGQKQRLAIARAFYASPQLYLWDDTISALDMVTERKIIQELFKVNSKAILVLATHRPSALRDFDKICYLEKGAVVEQGTFSELMEKRDKFYQLYLYEEMTRKVGEKEIYTSKQEKITERGLL